MDDLCQQLLDMIRQKAGRDVVPTDSFDGLQLDSMAMAELACEVEQRLAIRTDEGVLECETVEQFVRYAWSLKCQGVA